MPQRRLPLMDFLDLCVGGGDIIDGDMMPVEPATLDAQAVDVEPPVVENESEKVPILPTGHHGISKAMKDPHVALPMLKIYFFDGNHL